MGCASGKEEAATTDHEPPMFGKDIKVKLHKQGVLDQDFDVLDMKGKGPDDEGERWMLIDAVGTMGAEGLGGYDYFIKYKPVGAQKSYVLGAADDKSDQDYMSYVVTNGHVKRGQHKNVRLPWEKRNRRFLEKVVEADVIVVRRCRLYADEAKSTLVGRLDVSVQGKFTRVYRKEQWDVKKDKSSQRNTWGEPRSATKRRARFDIMNIQHKMVAYGTEYNIQFDTQKTGDILTSAEYVLRPLDVGASARSAEDGGRFFHRYVLQATRASDALPLFYVTSDGKKTANLETFSNSDPVNSILAAFVASIKMDPKELHTICKRTACNNIQFPRHLTGLIPTGERGGYGLTPNEYRRRPPWTPRFGAVD